MVVGLKSMAASAIVGATLAGWFGWPAAELTPGAVDIVGPCSPATGQWAETWRRAPIQERALVRVSLRCRPDGTASVVTLVYSSSAKGPRVVSWRPVTTFFEMLPAHLTERLEIFDQNGGLVEYATVDRRAGRIEFYSAASRLTGTGTIDTSFRRVERFSADGRRHESLSVPLPPEVEGGG